MAWVRIEFDTAGLELLTEAWPLHAQSPELLALSAHQLSAQDLAWLSTPKGEPALAAALEELAGAPELLAVVLKLPAPQQILALAVAGLLLIDDSAPLPLLQRTLRAGTLPEMNQDSTELLALTHLAASLELGPPEPCTKPPAVAPLLGTLLGLDAGDGWEDVPPFSGRVSGKALYFQD